MRPTGDSHRRALSPAVKPRDAEAMDVGVAAAVDDKLKKDHTNTKTKQKDTNHKQEERILSEQFTD